MFPWESRRTRRNGRDRRRPDITAAVENLEGRQLLAYNSFGVSLPDLTVEGFAAPVAAWGNPLAITANVKNIGSTTTIEPLALAIGATSTSDAPAITLNVYATPRPVSGNPHHPGLNNRLITRGAVQVGTISVPATDQNDLTQVTETITLPSRPAGFPEAGDIGIFLVVSPTNNILESDTTNNTSNVMPVSVQAPLPSLQAVGLDLPTVMQAGDTVQPNIRIANVGTVDTAAQGAVTVRLVASTTPDFNAGSTTIASYSLTNVPALSRVPSTTAQLGVGNLQPSSNIVTIAGAPVTLPASPEVFYVGVVIDPDNTIQELPAVSLPRPGVRAHGVAVHRPASVATPSASDLGLARQVGPATSGLPPAGVQVAGGTANVPVFPFPFGGNPVGGLPNGAGYPAPYPPAVQAPQSAALSTGTTSTATTTYGGYGLNAYSSATIPAAFRSRRAMLTAMNTGGPIMSTTVGNRAAGRLAASTARNGMFQQ